jgi:hypothetical protein
MAPLLTGKDMREELVSGTGIGSLFAFCKLVVLVGTPILGVFQLGCSPQNAIPSPPTGSLTRSVDAEWDNVATAVEVGAAQAQCAVVRTETSPDGLERRFEIKHVTGRHGVVSARTPASVGTPGSPSAIEPIELACSFGPTPDPELERRVLGRITHRLIDLRGKAFAPIR